MKTPKQNYLGMARGEKPDDLVFLGGYNPFSYGEGKMIQYTLLAPSQFADYESGGKDIWGVNWIAAESGGAQPDPTQHLLTDISKWREIIKVPDLSGIDWESQAQKELEANYAYGVSPSDTIISYWLHSGYITQLTNFMGFSEALMALYESPEDVYDLFEYMNNFYCEILDKTIPFYKPDTLHLFDTFAGSGNPFYSVELYKELVLPFHQKEADIAHKYNLPIEMHCAGKCEGFLDAMEPLGIRYWIGAEVCNDIPAIMEKHSHLVMSGGWQQTSEILKEDCTEETFKQSVRDVIDKYAPTGRFAWFDCILANEHNKDDAAKKNEWLRDVLYTYGKTAVNKI